ncbi:MAG: thioredoxin family protein [Ignavibacteriota bacterium]
MAYKFTKEFLSNSLSYKDYRNIVDALLSENRTTGNNQDPAMIDITRLNVARMNRIYKTTVINEEMNGFVNNKQSWVLISEGWCGDAANSVPLIAKMSELSNNIELHIIIRDEHPEVMNEYLTNGAKSIPILIVLDEQYTELFTWGPRPAELQKEVIEFKKRESCEIEELKRNVQMWYLNDKTISTQREILELLKTNV